ncbi:hypothetical protein [Sigmofec virus UA08Rod_5550]|uniref:Uncharacterized protein n=1 Tax=Sigmofec virus UA08Rod_5550 TaxID=2929429 RepID=A0A976N0N6_9VIRU|nr:hypothetical protein [Sigmofec virus UA08Rod_5550]
MSKCRLPPTFNLIFLELYSEIIKCLDFIKGDFSLSIFEKNKIFDSVLELLYEYVF